MVPTENAMWDQTRQIIDTFKFWNFAIGQTSPFFSAPSFSLCCNSTFAVLIKLIKPDELLIFPRITCMTCFYKRGDGMTYRNYLSTWSIDLSGCIWRPCTQKKLPNCISGPLFPAHIIPWIPHLCDRFWKPTRVSPWNPNMKNWYKSCCQNCKTCSLIGIGTGTWRHGKIC